MDSPLVITRGRRLTLALGVPLTLAVIVFVGTNLLSKVSRTTTAVDTSSAIQGTSLAIAVDEGDLTFVASGDNRVHVSGVALSSFAPARLQVSSSGGATALRLLCAPLPGPCSLSARIVVPRGVRVTADERSGTIAASGLLAGASLSTDSGDIQVRGLGGDLNLTSNSGSVAGVGLSSPVTVVNEHSGDVSLRFAAVPGRVQVDDHSGDISLTVPRQAYQVSAQSNSGSTSVGVTTNPSSRDVISALDDSGDIRIQPTRG